MARWLGWGVGLAVGAVLVAGCGTIPYGDSFEKSKAHIGGPPIPASEAGRGTRQGAIPLGPSAQILNSSERGGTSGLGLNGTLPAAMVRSNAPAEPEQRLARTEGEVAFVPDAHNRKGFGMTAQNGSNMKLRGEVIVRTISYTDPEGLQRAPTAEGAPPPRELGVGGSGGSQQGHPPAAPPAQGKPAKQGGQGSGR